MRSGTYLSQFLMVFLPTFVSKKYHVMLNEIPYPHIVGSGTFTLMCELS